MADDDANALLVGPRPAPAADQSLLAPLTPSPPAPEPSAPAGTTISVTLPPLSPETAEVAQQALSAAVNAIANLLPAAARRPKPKGSDPSAQALMAGLLKGLGAKYQDRALTKAGGLLEQRLVGAMPAVVAKSAKRPRKLRRKGGGKRQR